MTGAADRCDKGLGCRRRDERPLSTASVGPLLSRKAVSWRLVVDCSDTQCRGSSATAAAPLQHDSRQLGGNVSSANGGVQTAAPATSYVAFTRSEEESMIVRTAWEKLVRWSKSWQLLQARRQANALQKTKKVRFLSPSLICSRAEWAP